MGRHVFGVRHHGPGSARSLVEALERVRPQAVVIEGPLEANQVVSYALESAMRPPVALLTYGKDDRRVATHYPFAEFSPEWQALRYAARTGCHVRFMDLPSANTLVMDRGVVAAVAQDPLEELARAGGHPDGESWWGRVVEERRGGVEVFDAVAEAMRVLRSALGEAPGGDVARVRFLLAREAHMRLVLRAVEFQGYDPVAVVCGAWHVPALEGGVEKQDAERLRDLPKVPVCVTWIPWTHGRMRAATGYGAGIRSPGWYAHLWEERGAGVTPWMVRMTRALRDAGHTVSPAHAVEAVRLSQALAALREREEPGIEEMLEAARSVLTAGSEVKLAEVAERVLVGEAVGEVPSDVPRTALQEDFETQARACRLKREGDPRVLLLDLRKELDLARSCLLRRLEMMGIAWGRRDSDASGTGTFKEAWTLRWDPEFEVLLIEAGMWGATVEQACGARVLDVAARAKLSEVARLTGDAVAAGLDSVVPQLAVRLCDAAVSGEVGDLLSAIPDLAGSMRYGDVRGTARPVLQPVFETFVARVSTWLPLACQGLDEKSSRELLVKVRAADTAVTVEQGFARTDWLTMVGFLQDLGGLHGVVRGWATRSLLSAGQVTDDEVARRFGYELSAGAGPASAAAWADGFLGSSGALLVHDDRLWSLLDRWVADLEPEAFVRVLPVLRRAFADVTTGDRRRLLEKAQGGRRRLGRRGGFDAEAGQACLGYLARALGWEATA